MKIEREREGNYRRWSVELDDWLVRFVVLAVFIVVVPDAGVATAEALTVIAK